MPGATLNTGWKSPTANENATGGVSYPEKSYTSDNNRTLIADAAGQYYDLKTFGFSIPAGASINGILVSVEMSSANPPQKGAFQIKMSYDGGSNWSSTSSTQTTTSGTDAYFNVGGATDTWGRAWSQSEFSDANFRVRVLGNSTEAEATTNIDHVRVKVWYTDPSTPIDDGSICYASDGRKAGEGAGSGTGVLVFYDGSNYIACDTGTTVQA